MTSRGSSGFYSSIRGAGPSDSRPTGGWRAVVLLVAVMALIITTLDVATPADFRARALLGLVPIMVALLAPVTVTAVVTGLLICVYVGLQAVAPLPTSGSWAVLGPLMIGTGGLLGVLIARRREEQRARVQALTDIAEATQRAVMRGLPERFEDLRIADFYQPAARAARVGGDWYDFQPSPYGVRAVLGDVSGKGLPAVSASAWLLGAFREAAYHEERIEEVARRLEIAMQRYSAWTRITNDEGLTDAFSTGLLLHFPPTAPEYLDVVNFGHEPPLVVTADGRVHTPDLPAGLPLGMGTLGAAAPGMARLPFGVGDTLILFTDGVTECRDEDGTFYPVRERLPRLLSSRGAQESPEALLRLLAEDLREHRYGPPSDDAAITVIRRTAQRAPYVNEADAELYAYRPKEPADTADTAVRGAVAQYATDMRFLECASRSISSTKASA
ncbi:PP2C family protein-serine/threonine phosphatase [Streptomyces endophyticus]|uniref:Serine/threonine-protein phosphatase n=1 Tax=Streptomyces endophyticus TaxID=714166 RepID=A0ABU6FJB1_9ACTN|nr:PP2C family protein-serine/threonine phosphatase [Streptomyces endophyticus]MEB8344135.1 serine/threonine-protein phosphatase [Streptomyces endophyticus]